MKVCFVHAGLKQHGGIGRVVSIVANSLSKLEDTEIHVLSFCDSLGEADVYELEQEIKRSCLFAKKLSMQKALIKGAVLKLASYIRKNKIQIVIACGALYFPLVVMAGKLGGARSVCWEHTNPSVSNDYKFQGLARRFGMLFSDKNILITQAAKSFYDLRSNARKNVLIYNPAESALFKTTPVYQETSTKIISVGRLAYPKNYLLLVEIAAEIFEQFPEWQWHIYGDGEERNAIEAKIERFGLKDKVILHGNVKDIYERYDQYAFIVMTSRYEGFPMVLIEASARGLPMISFDIETGPNEIIHNGNNGYLIPNGNVAMMIKRIKELVNDIDKRRQFSRNAVDSAVCFEIAQITTKWFTVLTGLLR